MKALPASLVHTASFVLAALAIAQSAAAQIPVQPSPGTVEIEPEPAPSAAVAPRPEAALAPTTAAPAAPPPPAQPLPAKTQHLSERRVESSDDIDEPFEDEGAVTEAPGRIWYGWQTLIADGVSTTVFLAAFDQNAGGSDGVNETLAWAGILGYELGAGMVHFAHRSPARAFASFGIRLGMPLAGAFLGGAAISNCNGNDCQATGIGIGFLLGMGGAIALDAAVLAYESPEPRKAAARIMPLVSLSRERAWLGLAGEL